jgi:hypothetical protein
MFSKSWIMVTLAGEMGKADGQADGQANGFIGIAALSVLAMLTGVPFVFPSGAPLGSNRVRSDPLVYSGHEAA